MKGYIFTIIITLILIINPINLIAEEQAKKKILVIESYHADYAWDISYIAGLRSILGDNYSFNFFEMDTKRIPASEFEKKAGLAFAEYKKFNPDLVVLGDDNALKYVGPALARTETPVVYLGINNNPRKYKMAGHKNITGILERPLMKSSINTLKTLLPDLKKILILFDSGQTSKASLAEIFSNRVTMKIFSGVRADLKLIGNIKDWENTVKNAKTDGYNALIVGLYHTLTDSGANHIEAEKVLRWTSENTPVPAFGVWEFSVGKNKTIGGFVLSGKEQGIAAGKVILEIFSGKSPSKIYPKTAKKGDLIFSKAELEKWGINLPSSIAVNTKYYD